MIASIHQPNYLPYIGFFNKMKISDIFITLDTAQYVKNDFHNRNRIKGSAGDIMLTIPILSKQSYMQRIMDVLLPPDQKWARKHMMSISQNYKRSDYYNEYSAFFEQLYSNLPAKLVDLNESIILFLKESFNIKTKLIRASELDINPGLKATEALIEILNRVGADTYIAGKGREGKKHYLEENLMKENGINLRYHEFKHPIYKQNYNGFIRNLSAIDLLFNLGIKSGEMI